MQALNKIYGQRKNADLVGEENKKVKKTTKLNNKFNMHINYEKNIKLLIKN